MGIVHLSELYYKSKNGYEAEYQARWNSPYAIQLDFFIGDNRAFFLQTPQIQNQLSDILRMDKAVSNLRMVLPGVAINQFMNRCLVDEIVLTNNIEGVRSTRKEIGEILNELNEKSRGKRFFGLVQKYALLISGEEQPLHCCEDIRDIYDELVLPEILVDDPQNMPDGKLFRKEQNDILSTTQKVLHSGLYPESAIVDGMERALKFLEDDSVEILYRIGIFHYLFEYIHPFYDGNGRLGRFIASYLLSKNLDLATGYRLSYTIKEHISAYYKAFDICNKSINKGDLTPFLEMFMDVLHESMEKLQESLRNGLVRLNRYTARLDELEIEEKQKWLYELLIQAALFSEHGISMVELRRISNLSRGTIVGLMKKIPEKLMETERIQSAHYYKLNLEELDKMA